MKEVKDLKDYLDHIEKLSKPLSKQQKKDLGNILRVILTLLVSMKKSSSLGEVTINWKAL